MHWVAFFCYAKFVAFREASVMHTRKSHCGDKTILRPSYLHNGISYTGKMTSLYWIGAQHLVTAMDHRCHKMLVRTTLCSLGTSGTGNVQRHDAGCPYSAVYWYYIFLKVSICSSSILWQLQSTWKCLLIKTHSTLRDFHYEYRTDGLMICECNCPAMSLFQHWFS